jgi:predicted NAD-dependent protein-ADP-ribosyltransferase YbiA (DUF1768 family)
MQTDRATAIAVVEDATACASVARAAVRRQRQRLEALLRSVQRLAAMQRQVEAHLALATLQELLLDQTADLVLIEQTLDAVLGGYRAERQRL